MIMVCVKLDVNGTSVWQDLFWKEIRIDKNQKNTYEDRWR